MNKEKEERSKKQQHYDELIAHAAPDTTETMRREPHHLTYARKLREAKQNEHEGSK